MFNTMESGEDFNENLKKTTKKNNQRGESQGSS